MIHDTMSKIYEYINYFHIFSYFMVKKLKISNNVKIWNTLIIVNMMYNKQSLLI